jgi:hypothetical protein
MKKKYYLIGLLFLIVFQSCTTVKVYQVLKTKSDNLNSDYTFENEDIKCSYDLWYNAGGPPAAFSLYNKSDKPLFIDWGRSTFILGGFTYDYYDEATVTKSSSVGKSNNTLYRNATTTGIQSSYTASETYKQKRIQYVPPGTSVYKRLNSKAIDMIDNCEIDMANFKGEKEYNFEKSNTPFSFRNHVTYAFTETIDEPKVVDNDFWVNQVLLMKEKEFLGDTKKVEYCDGTASGSFTYTYPHKDKKSFYFSKSSNTKIGIGGIIGIIGGIVVTLVAIAVAS